MRPWRTVKLTFSSATMPPNRIVSCAMSNRGAPTLAVVSGSGDGEVVMSIGPPLARFPPQATLLLFVFARAGRRGRAAKRDTARTLTSTQASRISAKRVRNICRNGSYYRQHNCPPLGVGVKLDSPVAVRSPPRKRYRRNAAAPAAVRSVICRRAWRGYSVRPTLPWFVRQPAGPAESRRRAFPRPPPWRRNRVLADRRHWRPANLPGERPGSRRGRRKAQAARRYR